MSYYTLNLRGVGTSNYLSATESLVSKCDHLSATSTFITTLNIFSIFIILIINFYSNNYFKAIHVKVGDQVGF